MRPSAFLPGPLGLGTAPLGGVYGTVRDDEAHATLQAAWDHGIRYFDTAPCYGGGLAESRLGAFLAGRPRDSYALSSTVGRPAPGAASDYSAGGAVRSVEHSLRRLGVDRIDLVAVHDTPGPPGVGDDWRGWFDEACCGAFRALPRLREEGVVAAWGIATGRPEPALLLLERDDPAPDVVVLAGGYTLLDHEHALAELLPAALDRGVEIIAGCPYNRGLLVGRPPACRFAAPAVRARAHRLGELAERHAVGLKSAALQFCLAHPSVAATVPGAGRPDRVAEDLNALQEVVPAAFWADLRESGLVSPRAPLPSGE